MENTRRTITSNYKELEQLESFEELITYINGEGKDKWWNIEAPTWEIGISTEKTKANFKKIYRIRNRQN